MDDVLNDIQDKKMYKNFSNIKIVIEKLQIILEKTQPDTDNIVRRRSKGNVEQEHALSYVFSIANKLCQNEGIEIIYSIRIALSIVKSISKSESLNDLTLEKVIELIHSHLARLLLLDENECVSMWMKSKNANATDDAEEEEETIEFEWHSIINLRHSQEDRVVVIPDLRELLSTELVPGSSIECLGKSRLSLVGVFDGHKGSEASEHCSRIVCSLLTKCLIESNCNATMALGECLHQLNESLHHYQTKFRWLSGTTATICLIKNGIIYTAWLGDCQAWLLLSNGEGVALTDALHRPDYAVEQLSVRAYGGTISFANNSSSESSNHIGGVSGGGGDGGGAGRRSSAGGGCSRVSGMLAVSRSLGDDSYVRGICPLPSVTAYRLTTTTNEDPDHHCSSSASPPTPLALIVASDGLWDSEDCHGEAICDFVTEQVNNSKSQLEKSSLLGLKMSHQLCDFAASHGASDNVTVACAWLSLSSSSCPPVDLEDVHQVKWPRQRHRSLYSLDKISNLDNSNNIIQQQTTATNTSSSSSSPCRRRRCKSSQRWFQLHTKRFSSPMRIVTPE